MIKGCEPSSGYVVLDNLLASNQYHHHDYFRRSDLSRLHYFQRRYKEQKRMMKSEKTNEDAMQVDVTEGEVGDVETAGETTAAVMIGGPPDTRCVGEDTLANVTIAGAEDRTGNDNA